MSAPRVAWAPVQLRVALRQGKDETGSLAKLVDIGAEVSAREIAAEESNQSYFQYQDVLQHSKIIERRLIAAVGGFLAAATVLGYRLTAALSPAKAPPPGRSPSSSEAYASVGKIHGTGGITGRNERRDGVSSGPNRA
jgi:hypothetical protein